MTCNGKKVTIDGKEYVLAEPVPTPTNVVLVRTRSAGVHVGELKSRSGTEAVLTGAHRIWRWKGANSLHELAMKGGDTGYTRVSERVPVITLTEVIELIPCSEAGATNLCTARWP